jgi:predicted GNAT family N-acyltransferase
MADLTIEAVAHGSDSYRQTVALRQTVLRTPLGLVFTAEQLAAERHDFHFAALRGTETVGCFVLSPVDAGTFKLRQVAVASACQGQGIGRQMMVKMEDFALQQSIFRIILHAREPVVPFYEKLGYHGVGKRFMEVGIPHWRMEKTLSGPISPLPEMG